MPSSTSAKRGRPRDAATHQSILDAANQILSDAGYRGFSIEGVAAKAGVSKTSIYRRWPSKGALLLDLYMAGMDGAALADLQHLPIRDAFQRYLSLSVKRLENPFWTNTIQSLVAEAQADPEMADLFRAKVIVPRRESGRILLQRGIDEGQIDSSIDIDIVLDAVFGALWYRLLLGHMPIDQRFANALTDQVFAWIELEQ
ncbi:MAG: TetR/AcrR family transcriptional regulator [Alphaproteobacteria bacterium]|jgi:AcrR family transcriptional regulator|uniref:TetR/AcrR family transcriptional regulator n=1 Tax=Pacificispira sp. TaxID=2888761 RepID=UPI0032F72944